jgi:hypothetical protein
MADPITDSRTTHNPLPPELPPEDDRFRPITTPGLTEQSTERLNQSEEDAFQAGSDTTVLDADDIDRGHAARTAIQNRARAQPKTSTTALPENTTPMS